MKPTYVYSLKISKLKKSCLHKLLSFLIPQIKRFLILSSPTQHLFLMCLLKIIMHHFIISYIIWNWEKVNLKMKPYLTFL